MSPQVPPQAVLLAGGLVVDGSNAKAWTGDVLLWGERIAAMGQDLLARLPQGLKPDAVVVHDCRGKVIAPGFIDVHTHDDAIVLKSPGMLPKLSQGVTTVITGNCGISLAPYQVAAPQPPLNLLGSDSFTEDAVSAAKVITDFAKGNDKLVIIGGAYAGKSLSADGVKALAAIPSREVLISQIAGLLKSPIQRFAAVLSALAEKNAAAAPVAEAAPEAEAAPAAEVAATVEAAPAVDAAAVTDAAPPADAAPAAPEAPAAA